MIDPTEPLQIEANNNKKTMPKAGFNIHPENINKNGRPKRDWTWAGLLEEVAEEDHEFTDKRTGNKVVLKWKRAIAKKLYQASNSGNVHAIKELMDRMDGKPQENVRVDGEVNINFHSSLKQDE